MPEQSVSNFSPLPPGCASRGGDTPKFRARCYNLFPDRSHKTLHPGSHSRGIARKARNFHLPWDRTRANWG